MTTEKKTSTEEIKLNPIAMVFHYIGLLAFGLFSFLGLLHFFGGNIYVAGFITILELIVFWLVTDLLIKNKAKKPGRTVTRKQEYLLLFLYMLIAIAIFPFNFHSLEIEISQKDTIKTAGIAKLNALTELQNAYDKAIAYKKESYERSLDSAWTGYIGATSETKKTFKAFLEKELGSEISIDKKNLDEKKTKKAEQFKNKYELNTEKQQIKEYYETTKLIFENWNRLKLSFYYNDIDQQYTNYYQKMRQKMPDFKYKDTIKAPQIAIGNIQSSFDNLSFLGIALLIMIVMHACIMMPYIILERKGKGTVPVPGQPSNDDIRAK